MIYNGLVDECDVCNICDVHWNYECVDVINVMRVMYNNNSFFLASTT